jgi:hypothetical protein
MSDDTVLAIAAFFPITGQGEPIAVHFNPASLQYTVTNTLKEEGSGNKKKQFVTQSTGKLTMDLVFDTTDFGEDVRIYTEQLARFMEPVGGSTGGGKHAPAVVEFGWGTYAFKGMVDSYKETIDFFAPNGVPLRATINLSLSRQDNVFEPGLHSAFDTRLDEPQPVEVPATPRNDSGPGGPQGRGGQDATRLAVSAGNARAGRAIAAANGESSMRFSTGAALTVSPSIELGPPLAFASGGAGLGVGISGGIGASAGASASASASIAFGGRASAGVSASAGAFAGLRATSPPRATLDVERLIRRSETVSLGVNDTATFALGGQANIRGSASLSADVGASVSLRSRIQFEKD